MGAQHSPGPWKRNAHGELIDSAGNRVHFRQVITQASGTPERIAVAEANTRLAESAPDLLEALRVAVVALAGAAKHAPQLGLTEAYDTVSAAISKATGSSE